METASAPSERIKNSIRTQTTSATFITRTNKFATIFVSRSTNNSSSSSGGSNAIERMQGMLVIGLTVVRMNRSFVRLSRTITSTRRVLRPEPSVLCIPRRMQRQTASYHISN